MPTCGRIEPGPSHCPALGDSRERSRPNGPQELRLGFRGDYRGGGNDGSRKGRRIRCRRSGEHVEGSVDVLQREREEISRRLQGALDPWQAEGCREIQADRLSATLRPTERIDRPDLRARHGGNGGSPGQAIFHLPRQAGCLRAGVASQGDHSQIEAGRGNYPRLREKVQADARR